MILMCSRRAVQKFEKQSRPAGYHALDPTPEEIAATAAWIRQSWSEKELHSRAGIRMSDASIPLISSTGVRRKFKIEDH